MEWDGCIRSVFWSEQDCFESDKSQPMVCSRYFWNFDLHVDDDRIRRTFGEWRTAQIEMIETWKSTEIEILRHFSEKNGCERRERERATFLEIEK